MEIVISLTLAAMSATYTKTSVSLDSKQTGLKTVNNEALWGITSAHFLVAIDLLYR